MNELFKVIDAGNVVLYVGGNVDAHLEAADIELEHDRELRVVKIEDESELEKLRAEFGEVFAAGI